MRKTFSFLLIFSLLIVILIVGLEVLSKTKINKCPQTSIPREVCPIPINLLEKKTELEDLKRKRSAGEKFSKEDYYQIAERFILEVDPQCLVPMNGIAYSSIGYVRNDLPREAKKFVKRHELEHLFQLGSGEKRNREFLANLAAGKEYPLGLLQTIFFSLRERAKHYDSPFCYILYLWKTFKIYFMP